MPKYNVIYTSPNDDLYLWSGSSLDKLGKTDQEILMFSGRSFKEDELKEAKKQCISAVKKMFPRDDDPKIKTVEIKVSD